MASSLKKEAIIVHSGGMDSSICLSLAKTQFKPEQLLSISFSYGQRHSNELEAAKKINKDWGVDHTILDLPFMNQITKNSLVDHDLKIQHKKGEAPNSLVTGRNGLMARIAAIHAHELGANKIFIGVMELEEANSGYRDCNRRYIDLIQEALRIDFANPAFTIETPLIKMTKLESMILAHELGTLDYLWQNTISCYEGLPGLGCGACPACQLRNEGYHDFQRSLQNS